MFSSIRISGARADEDGGHKSSTPDESINAKSHLLQKPAYNESQLF